MATALPFLELADIYERRDEPKMRDRFLILAADAAFAAGQTQEAERLLQRLLQVSPHHMLKAYRSYAEAARAEPVRVYLTDLKQNYPPPVVEQLLQSLRGQNVPAEPAKAPLLPDNIPLLPEPSPQPQGDWPGFLGKAPAPPPRGSEPARLKSPASQPAPAAKPATIPVLPPPERPRPNPTTSAPQARRVAPPSPGPVPASRRGKAQPQPTSWLATLLFIVVFLGGLALLGFVLARPFLH